MKSYRSWLILPLAFFMLGCVDLTPLKKAHLPSHLVIYHDRRVMPVLKRNGFQGESHQAEQNARGDLVWFREREGRGRIFVFKRGKPNPDILYPPPPPHRVGDCYVSDDGRLVWWYSGGIQTPEGSVNIPGGVHQHSDAQYVLVHDAGRSEVFRIDAPAHPIITVRPDESFLKPTHFFVKGNRFYLVDDDVVLIAKKQHNCLIYENVNGRFTRVGSRAIPGTVLGVDPFSDCLLLRERSDKELEFSILPLRGRRAHLFYLDTGKVVNLGFPRGRLFFLVDDFLPRR